jgi:hypothetical protein
MPSAGQTKRISRIRRRAIPAVREAYERGDISARKADTLLYLPAGEQQSEIGRLLDKAHRREEKNRLVAGVIRQYLDNLGKRKVDLIELSKLIKEALNVTAS